MTSPIERARMTPKERAISYIKVSLRYREVQIAEIEARADISQEIGYLATASSLEIALIHQRLTEVLAVLETAP